MKKRNLVVLVLASVLVLEVVFVPVEQVLVSIPNQPLVNCTASPQGDPCTFAANYYKGGGSLAYCLLGIGALYVKGVYYPIIQPRASPGREISNRFCPAMK